MNKIFKSGYIAILGLPNAGKSTLMNSIIGEKIAIVTAKPHTTRDKHLGILTLENAQMIFLDTPGIHDSKQNLNQYMMSETRSVIEDADILLFMVGVDRVLNRTFKKFTQEILEKYHGKKSIFVIINKVDIPINQQEVKPEEIDELFPDYPIFPISALNADGIEELIEDLIEALPEGPAYYPEDQISTQDLRDICKEFIREKAFSLLKQEIPYGLAVSVEEFNEEPNIIKIRANIIVETESQKHIVIGNRGSMIKKIGIQSREEIEKFLQQKVFLDLRVKVDKKWSKTPNKMARYGYKLNKYKK